MGTCIAQGGEERERERCQGAENSGGTDAAHVNREPFPGAWRSEACSIFASDVLHALSIQALVAKVH